MLLLPYSEIYKINGKPIFSPTSASVSIEDLETSAERTADGTLHRERARQGVRKISFTYDRLTQEEMQLLIPMLSPVFFELTYLDPENGTNTITCYCASKSSDLYSAVFYDGYWMSVKFNCIEK